MLNVGLDVGHNPAVRISLSKLIFGIAFFTIAIANQALAGSVDQARITKIAINKDLGPMLFIATDSAKVSNPACHTNGTWTFVLPLNDDIDQKMMAIILAARALQAPIALQGNGQCNVFGSVETLVYQTY